MSMQTGRIGNDETLTLREFVQRMHFGKAATSPKAKMATVRKNLREIGCPLSYFGREPVVVGRLFNLAMERKAMDDFESEFDGD